MITRNKFNLHIGIICVIHTTLFLGAAALLGLAQLRLFPAPLNSDAASFWITVSLTGLIGAFLFFGRKCYSYIINDKYDRITEEAKSEDIGAARIWGYYLYLILRPFAGLAIGPIAAMLVMAGVSAVSSQVETAGPQSISDVGIYAILVSSFVGGYTSSDLFDRLSKFGKTLIPNSRS